MKPIGLTRILVSGNRELVYVNPAYIVSFAAGWKDAGSYVWVTPSESYIVAETPAQIIGLLADHRSTMRAEERDGIEVYHA